MDIKRKVVEAYHTWTKARSPREGSEAYKIMKQWQAETGRSVQEMLDEDFNGLLATSTLILDVVEIAGIFDRITGVEVIEPADESGPAQHYFLWAFFRNGRLDNLYGIEIEVPGHRPNSMTFMR